MGSSSPTTAVPTSRRRDKPQLSCSFCRQKKLRCDREKPCQSCVARGRGPSCTYPTRGVTRPRAPPSPVAPAYPSLMKRLDNLEDSLISLVHGSGRSEPQLAAATSFAKPEPEPSSGMATAPLTPTSPESGSMHCSPAGTVYVSSAHWTSILDSISELRDCLGRDESHDQHSERYGHPDPAPGLDQEEQPSARRPHLLSGLGRSPTMAELLSAMPDRSTVDRHVFWYFKNMRLIFLHTPSFLRDYEAFWANPFGVSPMWLSILYSIMSMTPLDHGPSASTSDDVSSAQAGLHQPMYLDRVIQCLVVGDYNRGGPYAIEALHHYFALEHAGKRDVDVRNWTLYGLIIQLALRKGYHREPSQFPNISPFEGEIRRRMWILLYGMDVLVSIQMGTPRLIKDEQCDTMPPRNLLDTDFDEDTKELPAPRPGSEITLVTFWVARYRIMTIMAKIADMSLTIGQDEDPCSSRKIKHVDTLLRTTYDQLPEAIKFTSLPACLAVSPEDIIHKLIVRILLQKGLILLHRRHVVRKESGSSNPDPGSSASASASAPVSGSGSKQKCSAACVAESVRTCTDAALQILEYQDSIHWESQKGGALAPVGWRLSSSALLHEFLMATSVLCSFLYRVYRGDPDMPDASAERVRSVEKALARAQVIWQSQSGRSKDARRATDTIGMVIGKLKGRSGAGAGAAAVTTTAQPVDGVDIPVDLMPELQCGVEEAMLYDGFGVYGEVMNPFAGMITW